MTALPQPSDGEDRLSFWGRSVLKRLVSAPSCAAVLACAAIAGAMGAFSFVSPASAATVTKTIQFEASDFIQDPINTPISLPSVTGQVTVTFDPTVDTVNQTAGITLDNLSIPIAYPLEFTFKATPPGDTGTFQFLIGGTDFGPSAVGAGHNDFSVVFLVDSSLNILAPGGVLYGSTSQPGVVNRAREVQVHFVAVPEPSTWTLMIGGVALLGAALRVSRRRAAAIEAAPKFA